METPKTNNKKHIVIGVVATVAIIGIVRFAYENYMYVTTDNAFVSAHTTLLAMQVPGKILKMDVQENQKVKAGELLVQIDDRNYQNMVKQAEGDLGSVQARLTDAETNYHRISGLYKSGAVSQQQFDQTQAMFKDLQRKLSSAQAQVDQARLNLEWTHLKAPTDGTIAKTSAELGMLANVGQPVLGFVQANERWIVANLKETDLSDIKVGQSVTIEVDAVAGEHLHGKIESLSPGTGASFSLLPPDNATGNFTKVVQRIPVRIKLEDLTPAQIDRLQAGLSAYVKIRIH
jgi:membrane fusion protein (multidrug efflux system)